MSARYIMCSSFSKNSTTSEESNTGIFIFASLSHVYPLPLRSLSAFLKRISKKRAGDIFKNASFSPMTLLNIFSSLKNCALNSESSFIICFSLALSVTSGATVSIMKSKSLSERFLLNRLISPTPSFLLDIINHLRSGVKPKGSMGNFVTWMLLFSS